jgi:hypothetical protein
MCAFLKNKKKIIGSLEKNTYPNSSGQSSGMQLEEAQEGR